MRRKAISGTTIVLGVFLLSLVAVCVGTRRQRRTVNTVITVGMPYSDAYAVLTYSGALALSNVRALLHGSLETPSKDLLDRASDLGVRAVHKGSGSPDVDDRAWCYLLPDGTCLEVRSTLEPFNESVVTGIVLGERGKSYRQVVPWAKQKKVRVQRIDFSNYTMHPVPRDLVLRVGMCLLEAAYKLGQIGAREFSGSMAAVPHFAWEAVWTDTLMPAVLMYDLPDGTILLVWAQCDLAKEERTFEVKRLTLGQRIPHPVGMDFIDEKTYTTPQEIDLNDFRK